MIREVLIDTTALGYFAQFNDAMNQTQAKRFDIFGAIRMLFHKVHVPMEVHKEFSKFTHTSTSLSAPGIVQKIISPSGFLQLCPHYDLISKAALGTDKNDALQAGEKKAIAQARKTRIRFFITDDIRCAGAIAEAYSDIKCLTSLVVLASLDIHGYLQDRDSTFSHFLQFYQQPKGGTKRSSAMLRQAYTIAQFHYSVQLSAKELSARCSAKRLGIGAKQPSKRNPKR